MVDLGLHGTRVPYWVAETWRRVSVEEFGRYYLISDVGRVLRIAPHAVDTLDGLSGMASAWQDVEGKVLKPYTPPSGYPCVTLYADGAKRTFLVYRLVARAFHGEKPKEGYVIAHSNGDRGDSSASNLRWCTQAENMRDMVEHGNSVRGEDHYNSKLTVDEVIAIKEMRGAVTARGLARQLGLAHSTVIRIWSGERWGWL